MKQEFSLAHLTVIECSPAEMTYIAARTGYDYVSLRLIPMAVPGEYPFSPLDKQMVRETKAALHDTGVRFLDLELARILPDQNPQQYVPAMELAAELGARHVISSAWNIAPEDRGFMVERYAQICELANPFGLTVELEFPSFSSITSLQEATDIIRSAGCSNCGLLLDTLYFHFSGLTSEELTKIPREWFHFLHLCDAVATVPETKEGKIRIARDERLYIGEGCIDFASVFSAIPQIPFSIELPNSKRVKDLGYEEHARRCIESAKQYLQDHSVAKSPASV